MSPRHLTDARRNAVRSAVLTVMAHCPSTIPAGEKALYHLQKSRDENQMLVNALSHIIKTLQPSEFDDISLESRCHIVSTMMSVGQHKNEPQPVCVQLDWTGLDLLDNLVAARNTGTREALLRELMYEEIQRSGAIPTPSPESG